MNWSGGLQKFPRVRRRKARRQQTGRGVRGPGGPGEPSERPVRLEPCSSEQRGRNSAVPGRGIGMCHGPEEPTQSQWAGVLVVWLALCGQRWGTDAPDVPLPSRLGGGASSGEPAELLPRGLHSPSTALCSHPPAMWSRESQPQSYRLQALTCDPSPFSLSLGGPVLKRFLEQPGRGQSSGSARVADRGGKVGARGRLARTASRWRRPKKRQSPLGLDPAGPAGRPGLGDYVL